VNNSESTLKHKYSNAVGVNAGSNSKSRQVAVEDSIASSSYLLSSVGGDDKLKSKLQAGNGSGKTHINVGALNFSAK